jgi:glycine cleavage system H protein
MGELFSLTHEWVRISGDTAEIGISDFAQHSLGDVVFVDLPRVGDQFDAKQEFGAIESVKAASELLMPIKGTVIAINEALIDHPEMINTNPLKAWLIKIKVAQPVDVAHLLDVAAYEQLKKE